MGRAAPPRPRAHPARGGQGGALADGSGEDQGLQALAEFRGYDLTKALSLVQDLNWDGGRGLTLVSYLNTYAKMERVC